jgi:hypothetical protein
MGLPRFFGHPIIAHERGHQLLYRHELLGRILPRGIRTRCECADLSGGDPMMENKKPSTIREELRAAFAAEGADAIASLDRKIRRLANKIQSEQGESPSLLALRKALAQLTDANAQQFVRAAGTTRKKAK